MKLETAVSKFLDVIERDAKFNYREHIGRGKTVWNEAMWKKEDPEYYKHWKRIKALLK